MPFITTPERVGIERGLRKGIESLLKVRFGDEGLKLMPEIQNIYEDDKLDAIRIALETAGSPDEVRSVVGSSASVINRRIICRSSQHRSEGLKLMPEIQNIHEEEKLVKILNALETAVRPNDVPRLWTTSAPR